MRLTSLTAPLALSIGLAAPSGALAAGGPVPPVQGARIAVPGSPDRYFARSAGHDTIVKRTEAGPGSAASELRVSGSYGIPAVAFGGPRTGLSADGRTLVIAAIPRRYPPHTTRLIVLDTPRLAVRARIALPGWSTVDAISPDGRWLYLLHYPSANISTYEVLAYDLVAHRLLAKPVVDPRDRREPMVGFAVTRVMSHGGQWAYTFYFRPSGVPFIHALDTSDRRAVCIDLPSLRNADVSSAHLSLTPDGGMLEVNASGAGVLIDTRTFAVTTNPGSSVATTNTVRSAPAPVRPAPRRRRPARALGSPPWGLIIVSIAALAGLATLLPLAKRRRRVGRVRVPTEAGLGRPHLDRDAHEPADRPADREGDEVPAA
jgi:hypothetical protein